MSKYPQNSLKKKEQIDNHPKAFKSLEQTFIKPNYQDKIKLTKIVIQMVVQGT